MVAASLLVKQQLLILNRSRRRAPNLRLADRVVAGVCTLLITVNAIRNQVVADHETANTWSQVFIPATTDVGAGSRAARSER
jgi:hypothetical protein